MPDLGVATLLLASGTAAAAVIGLIRYRVVFLSEPSHGPNGHVVHNLYLGVERRKLGRRRAAAVTGGSNHADRDPPDGSAASGAGDGPEQGGGRTGGLHIYVVWKR
ncbi:hypothetical protein [Prosthecodimorpha staleyi]|uniref:Uncharacterized protein n=1 Tax=Prosthecodimorpha staleyi TaxID=2840188 RepID=A0A947D2K1_9HYPH|nr:hypothetical protein [Prosthecodimorpha staleyi]MBT9289149.1 hypothetical protein [Prosthecodimorpha staleyi]